MASDSDIPECGILLGYGSFIMSCFSNISKDVKVKVKFPCS